MKRLLIALFLGGLLGLASAATAFDNPRLGSVAEVAKPAVPTSSDPGTPDGREGGETIETAFVINAIPFTDTGNTSDNIHDYEASCPFGSNSPDVVYVYTPPAEIVVDIDLCHSLYDTKVFVYAGDEHDIPVACNDDFWFDPPCFEYSSFIGELTLAAGIPYYIVVDGYSGASGDYVLEITEFNPCVVSCPGYAVPEGEPPLAHDYEDTHNGGCSTSAWQTIDWIDDQTGCGWMCASSGWFHFLGGDARDTDWFEVTAGGQELSWTVNPEYPVFMFVILPDCNEQEIILTNSVLPCVPGTLTWATQPGEVYWLWVGPTVFTGPEELFEFDYNMEICGLMYGTIPTVPASWGEVKSLYR